MIYAGKGRAGNLKSAMFHAAHHSHIIDSPLDSVNERESPCGAQRRQEGSHFASPRCNFVVEVLDEVGLRPLGAPPLSERPV